MRLPLAALLAAPLCVARAAAAQDTRRPPADTARRLPGVVVTATRDTGSALSAPLPTSVLGASALRRDHGVSLAHTIAQLPGVRALSTGEQIGKPVVRGLTGPRVLVLDDGLRLEDYSWSDEDGPSIEARLAERVEVVRGPASVLYGSDALGGVVNSVPAPLLDARGGPGLRRGQLELYGASNNREGGGVLGLEGARGTLAGRVTVVGRLGQDVHTPAGEIRNTGFGAFNGEGVFGVHHAGGAETLVRLAHYGGEFKLLETDAPPNGEAAGGETEEEGGPERVALDDRLQLTHRRRAGALGLEARAQVQRHLLQEKSDVPDPQPGQPKDATVFDLLLTTATAELLAHHGRSAGAGDGDAASGSPLGEASGASRPAWRGTVGLSGLYQQNDSRGIVPLVPDARVLSGGAFAFERLGLGRLALLAGLRGDARHLTADADTRLALADQSRSYTAVTGALGAVYRIRPALALALNAGRAWRAPTLFELFANGPRLGEGRYEYGQPALKPERSLGLDAGLRWEGGRVRAEASAFRTRIDDFITVAPTADVQDGLRVYRYGRADATLVGGELGASVAVSDVLALRGRFDAVRGTNTTADDPLPLMPPVRVGAGAEVRARPGRFGRPFLGADVEYVARQTRLSAAEREASAGAAAEGRFPLATGAYALVDVSAGAEVRLGGRATRVDLRVRNATDRRYRDFLNRYKEFAYAPGADVVLRLATTF